ncbi:hypothetical protein DRQ05_02175 [bacterium]|nr:MAG: hypothetical protein DRQ05_02175 [bacterium]
MFNEKKEEPFVNCWEYLGCDKRDCSAYGVTKAPCWEITGNRCGDEVFPRFEEKLIHCCFKCPYFKKVKERVKGRRWVDITLLETLEDALVRSSKYSKKVEDLYMEVIRRSKLMNLLSEVSKIIARLEHEEDIILAILTVITAKQGLGFNRGFVFLKGPEYDMIRGKYALGPSSLEEAQSIWKILEKDETISLEKLVSKGQKLMYLKNSPLTRITSRLSIALDEPDSLLIKGMEEVRFLEAKDLKSESDRKIANVLGLEKFCVCPIASAEDHLGFIIVDNIFTGQEITPEDAHLLEMIVEHATTSLRAAQLKESLKKNIESLKANYRKLKMYEERIMKAERLAISGELTSSIIHEIKNPLVAIGGFARNLLQSTSVSCADREKIEIIANEAFRLESYLNGLQSKVTELKLEEADVNQVLEDNCNLLTAELKGKNIQLIKDFSYDLPLCKLDQVKIHEVFLNLLQNAVDAVERDGTIRVKTWSDSENVYVEISDSGKGIPRHQIDKIFTPFFTTKEEGSGLGLAFAHKIVKDHKGNISVSSTEGKGTTFTVTFPSSRVSSKAEK